MSASGLNPVDVVLASAGTGKTTRLVRLIKSALEAGLKPEQVLATTFTNAAADELRERTRANLVSSNQSGLASAILGARMGTVHSVCGSIITEFALEAGRSPVTEVLAEDASELIFSIAADAVIAKHAPNIQASARRAGLVDHWADKARKIIELARQNSIAAEGLSNCAERSWKGLSGLLEPAQPGESTTQLNAALRNALEAAIKQFPNPGDTTKKTADGVEVLRDCSQRLGRGQDLSWLDWARLAKVDVGARSKTIVQPVQAAASVHLRHPQLREDLEKLTRTVFQCAAEALAIYQETKEKRGWLDFTDQEREALTLLRRPDVAMILKERIGQVFVDEFQDTSPVQLAIFTELAKIANHSTWVGDPKQAIYGFRGTDPELMALASNDVIRAAGGKLAVLNTSFRSRPGLVDFVNDVFTSAASILGLPPGQIRIEKVDRKDPEGMLRPLAVWRIPGNKDQGWLGLAAGVRKILDAPSEWSIVPKEENESRPVRPSDIAILCGTNNSARKIADALAAQGIKAAVGRSDLLGTLECRLALAAIRWTADGNDRLALAEMAHLLELGTEQPAWFATAFSEDPTALEALVPFAETLKLIRSNILSLTPAEVIGAILLETGMANIVRRWGKPLSRAENLQALRILVESYQEACRQQRAPATLTGLIAWLDDQSEAKKPPEQPASTDPEAIQVLTYHRAKGLEWPLVIMAELDRRPTVEVFEPTAENNSEKVSWSDPLAGRTVRYWPWPYGSNQFGQKTKDVGLDVRAQRTPEWREAGNRTFRESARVLYVGMTRARDYLVFALSGTRPTGSLDILADGEGRPYLGMPAVGADDILVGTDKRHSARVEEYQPTAPWPIEELPVFGSRDCARVQHPPLNITASAAVGTSEGTYRKIDLGGRLTLTGKVDVRVLGEAVHRFLAADQGPSNTKESREKLAGRILKQWSVSALSVAELILASDRLHNYVKETWPGSAVLREVPVSGRRGLQRITGRIDLLVEGADALAVIDHKSFPGAESEWPARVTAYRPQLTAYGEMVISASQKKLSGLFVYLPIPGTLLDLTYNKIAK